ncbi:MFS transporter [Bifidobacterium subtile]|uniref:Putative proline/betaine transporter n=1 Tax=Bifidobacterium subtile TaxID=77635 RepID=A0A087E8S3_9BIFI|nr:MFS transporter [Bifidobacterium subtile]KFJ04174.1 major facilitator superfamily transporter [Bifidobacterium subtile]MCI1223349.1 MHS family MFS transporter [Bifidobacterium subtile]QOL36804.1 MHS family MFS transporter [Bifidobacterium subtile]
MSSVAEEAAGATAYSAAAAKKTQSKPLNSPAEVIAASLVGTTVEFYDFYVYATAAVLVFPKLFFPSGNPVASQLASFGVFGAAMIARPVGAIFYGHMGDKRGRKATLVACLMTMGIATFLVGLLPTFDQIGLWAALLLLILRLTQGFALGGEWSGAALVATENAPEDKRALYGTFPQLGAPIGFIIANGLFLIINFSLPHPDSPTMQSEAFLSWGWRIPFLFSSVMVIIGLYVRSKLAESETFKQAEAKGTIVKVPLFDTLRHHMKAVVLGTFAMLATYVLFYLMTTFSLSYGTHPADQSPAGLGITYTDFVLMQIIGVVFFGLFTILSGPLADSVGRRKLLLWITGIIIVFALMFPIFLDSKANTSFNGALVEAFLIIGFTLMGFTFGPMGALLPEMFPTNVRYTGSAIAYNVSSIIGAALAPIIATALWSAAGGSTWMVGVYLAIASVLTLISLILTKETKDIDFNGDLGAKKTK